MTQQGNFYWNELLTTDPEACKKFYGEVVGWTSREMDMGNGAKYTIVKVGDKDAEDGRAAVRGRAAPLDDLHRG